MKAIGYVAGKSGGHIVPALTLAHQYKQAHGGARVLFFSTHSTLDKNIIGEAGVVDYHVPLELGNFPRKKIWLYPQFIIHFFQAFLTSFKTLRHHKPARLVSMGGYISLPVCFAAWLLRIPIDVYELNVIPGKAVKVLALLASRILVCFPEARRRLPRAEKVEIALYPVRFKYVEPWTSEWDTFELDEHKKTILILGGSQGSRFMNQLADHVARIPNVQIIHQAGAHDVEMVREVYAQHRVPALVFSYCSDMQDYYSNADIIICRAGAGTLFETLFFKKRTITIPLEAATTDHQVDNAYAMARRYPELFTVVRQAELLEGGKKLNMFIE